MQDTRDRTLIGIMTISCAKCQHHLPEDLLFEGGSVTCPSCRAAQTVTLFPVFKNPSVDETSSAPVFEGDAACYYDPDKRAVAVCDDCGRFISDFHRVILDSEHTTCLACLSEARHPKSKTLTQTQRTVHDNFALSLAVVPPMTLMGIYVMPFTALAALYLVIRYWKSGSNSFVPRGRKRFVIAAIIALLELILVAAAVIGIFMSFEEY